MLLRKVMCVLALGSCGLAVAQAPGSNRPDTNTATPSAPPMVPGVAVPTAPVQQPVTPDASTPGTSGAASTGAQMAATGGTKVHGTVMDPDGAIIPGATVVLQPKAGNAARATSGPDGSYTLSVKPGVYTLLVTMKGFASYSVLNLKVPAVAGIAVDAKLAIGETTEVVNVEASGVSVSVDQDSNASATILTGKDLEALSDDPDELQSELTALAGPSAGPNGGQIYVDGFTGGQLPPKSSIREIRINQNPFSAQYDRLGYGRVEIFTKPGTDQFHGSFQMNGNASQFNAGHAPDYNPAVYVPPYHTVYMFGSISGPLAKWASFNVGGSHRDIEDDAYTNGILYGHAGATVPCAPGDATCVQTPVQIFTHQPQSRTDITPRFDLALGKSNVLTTRFQVNRNEQVNQGVGTFALPSAGYYSNASSFELQMSDTQTYGLHVINETRFEWERERARVTPNSTALNVSVSSAFTSGGSTAQGSDDHQDHFEVQNYTSIQTKKNFIRLGGRFRSTREAIDAQGGTNGSFTYSTLAAYAANTPNQYTRTVVNNDKVEYTLADLGLYAESDWKPLSNLTVSYGVRYEVQNHFQENHDVAPRVSFAWGVGKEKTKPKTVIRGGMGIFYDRFAGSSVLKLLQNNGSNYLVTTYTSGSLPAGGCSPTNLAACTLAASGTSVYTTPDQNHHMTSPYIIQYAIGADQQIGKIGTVSVNFLHALGVHELAVQDVACAPNSIAVCTNQATFNNQYLTAGQFHQDQLVVNPKFQIGKAISLFGFYSLMFDTAGNNSGASTFLSQPGNINADLGRPSFYARNKYFMAGSVSLPAFIQVSPFLVGQSGSPFNITEGVDINGDGVYNDRPYLVPAGTAGAVTLNGCGTFLSRASGIAPPAGSSIVPVNYCNGPAQFSLNVRATKTWGFGGSRNKNAGDAGQQGGGGRQRGQGGMGGPGGGGPGGGGGGGRGGGFFGGGSGSNTGQRYNFALGINFNNLTNRANLAAPVGTISSPKFGQSTQLAGQPYNTQNAALRMSLQASFTF